MMRESTITRLADAALANGPVFAPAPGLVYLESLDEGDAFLASGRRGTVRRIGIAGVTVEWDNPKEVSTIAGHTEVSRTA